MIQILEGWTCWIHEWNTTVMELLITNDDPDVILKWTINLN